MSSSRRNQTGKYPLVYKRFVLSRGFLYALLSILIVLGYALLVSGLGMLMASVIEPGNPIIIGIAIFLLALIVNPLKHGLEKVLESLFFRGEHVYQERLGTFSGDLTNVVGLVELIQVLRRYVVETLNPLNLHIFLFEPLIDQYVAAIDENKDTTSDVRFSASSPLVQMLNEKRSPIRVTGTSHQKQKLQADQVRVVLLGAEVLIPLPGRDQLTGWMALGPRRMGELYSSRDLEFLEALGDQAALAIERAQIVSNMEDRVREMNMLTRVAQGINITLEHDDMLELIYAQTTQIIPADDFHIFLLDQDSPAIIMAFNVEDNERLTQHENQPVDLESLLEREIISQRRHILTNDFSRECISRGIKNIYPEIYAWMGVPLNSGAETIGALSLGSRDPDITYTQGLVNLLQAIADQVAGAIIKARLLEETKRRAQQLASLNEVSRQLTSNLNYGSLLESILLNAVSMLNSEAGSLLLIDDDTNELVFEVTVGPVADELHKKRMPSGSGLVGKSVKTGKPVIVNNVYESPDWYEKSDQETGFVTRSLLVVPLEAKDTILGVIEVINKKDGSPFNRDDEQLLIAFAAQATIAIENVRLYTMTDQALESRVEELSILQRIGRELNTSLDTKQTMQITLDWALRQSENDAGLVGILEGENISIMAFKGYSDELDPFENLMLPVDQFKEVLDRGLPQSFSHGEKNDKFLLKNARSQIVIPIRREVTSIGMILLESEKSEQNSDETINFLQRLTDHAAIAISNAQLYAAVQKANLAKSEFVSFVSHELKNPMTSIKGYSELISAGAVGSVNDAQMNFLNTIRSNVDRMANLVSDLADESRIEAGRLRLDFKAFDVREIIDEVIRSETRMIEEKNLEVAIDVPQDLPPVWADRTRLVQVLTNLVSNARKYTLEEGKIHISAEACENKWDPEGASKVVHFWVEDNGLGISQEDQERIFQKFFRADDVKTREVPGTGLGLNITRSLVETQGGVIWFSSEYRNGTTFHFTVPVSEQ